MGVPLALPCPSDVRLFVCSVRYLPTGLLCLWRLGGPGLPQLPPALRPLFLLALSELCPAGSPCLGCPCLCMPGRGWGVVGSVCVGGQWHPTPPTVGSLNCLYGAVPTLEFLYTSCFGVLSYICTYRGGIWGDNLGERGAAARLGLGTVVLGVGTGAVGPPLPRQGSAPREGCHLWVPMGPGAGGVRSVPLPVPREALGGSGGEGGW